MRQKDYSLNYSRLILFGLAFLYFVIPILTQLIVGEEFYIYSKFQLLVNNYNFYFLGSLAFFLALLFLFIPERTIKIPHLSLDIFKVIFLINTLYQIWLIFNGIYAKYLGFSRLELLGKISSLLIPGYGYLLILACISIIKWNNRKALVVFVLFSFTIDFLFQGKIFATISLMLLMFYLDLNKIKLTTKRVLLLTMFGFAFLISVVLIRSKMAISGDTLLSVYNSFSEFMGVQATSGWGLEYYVHNKPQDFLNFDTTLQTYYFESVGHGLALSPLAYFLGNFGYNFFFYLVIYFCALFLIYYLSAHFMGKYSIFVLMVNYIHLLRHGPNVFLFNSIFQIVFLCLIIVVLSQAFNGKIIK
ncbi:hypothetical protein Pedsa_3238 [Pseudopedobacter saltans DSM 12145]|uniref:O-antigen polymerase n=1 Tax=Pseudopedobacter saltans (strain ATCC 51119 / DSM 12145 / JCM 21818 / CCUG 39354 / LMG 10337 / NBRC 100064 / NCIMB 13643) TaxID=762903 RepID=F0SBE7_PSESL|nr:hypothetical protein [Pseudopedobacter saltans]ADY53774.1 hypothetical protein Pedsa_3238 [Pseudopedobacter saltans DSM 12145]